MKLIDIIKSTKENIFLNAEGGAGKSTALIDLHKTLLNELNAERTIPLYIPLRGFDGKADFLKNYIIENYIHAFSKEDTDDGNVGLYKKLKKMIETSSNYRFLLLCDGINEISINSKEIYTEINDFSEWANIQIIVSSRHDVKNELRSFIRYKIKPIYKSFVRDKIEEYDSLPKNLRTLLLTPFYFTIYQKTDLEKRMTASNAGQLLQLHYRNMILRSTRTEHREFSELLVFEFVPLLCFQLSLNGSLAISDDESDKLFEDWYSTLRSRKQLKIREHGTDRFDYIETICGYGIASYDKEFLAFHEINRDFFAAYYEKDRIEAIEGEEYAEAANRNILNFIQEFLDKNYKKVVIPKGVTQIDEEAFAWCDNITNINIPIGVETIGKRAFLDCGSLTSVNIPDDVTRIDEDAFCGCRKMFEINVSENNKKYSDIDGILYNKTKTRLIRCPEGIKETVLKMPSSVKSIEHRAFWHCNGLERIEISEGVTSIDGYAFDDCRNLIQIKVNKNNKQYSDIDGILYNKTKTRLIRCPMGRATNVFEIPTRVTSIGDWAFYGCNKLTNIIIPLSVTNIDVSAFNSCRNLKKIHISNNVTRIGDGAFFKCDNLTDIYIPNSVMSIGSGAFKWCSRLESIELSNRIISINDQTFDGCYNLTKINIPEGVTNIGHNAFRFCINLKSINIPYGLISIGNGAFSGCESLFNIYIPQSVTEIDKYAFWSCNNLILKCRNGSYIHKYAIEYGIKYELI